VQDEYTICMLLHNKTCYQHLMKRHKKGILCPNKKHIIHHTHTDTKLSITILRLIDCFIVFNATFSYIMVMATSFSGGRSQSTRREPPTMGKQLENFITCDCESSALFFVNYKAGCEPTPYW
jgi:hypothetical protein